MYGPGLALSPDAVAPERIIITYAAHTTACTFLLDAEGICRRIVMNPSNKRRDSAKTASQCVGAQYVASLDGAVAGCLVEMPRVGAAMLFARVDERGRVSLVRTGPVQRFEQMRLEEDPFEDNSVRTSAPEVPASARNPRKPPARQVPVQAEPDPDYFDASDRTMRISAVKAHDLATQEYPSSPPPPPEPPPTVRREPRSTLPSPAPRTLQNPRVELHDEDNPYAQYGQRGALPRRSDPHLKAARTSRPSSSRWATAVATRRRER
jgi:hypothetical protein